jgi:hypothetical protein
MQENINRRVFSKHKEKEQKTEILHHTPVQYPLMLEEGADRKRIVLRLYRLCILTV